MQAEALRARMLEKNTSVQDLAAVIGMDPSTFYRKLAEDGEKFTVSQVRKIAHALGMTPADVADIFYR